MKRKLLAAVASAAVLAYAGPSLADMAAAEKWIDEEFQPSTLSREEQLAEMEWFINAAQPFAGMEINVLSETIPTHTYESEVLAQAFFEITGRTNVDLRGFFLPWWVAAIVAFAVVLIILVSSVASIRKALTLDPAVVVK